MEDDKIESFFRDMRTADEHLPVPPFTQQKKPHRLWPMFLYAAAAAVVAIVITVRYVAPATRHTITPERNVVIIFEQDGLESHSLIETGEAELSGWESPTSFLSEDF